MKFHHHGFMINQMRKRQKAAEGGKASAQLQIQLRRQITNLRKENLKLRSNIKINVNNEVCLPEKNAAVNINETILAEQEDRNLKLTQANAQLIITSVELQVAVDEIKNAKAEMHHLAHYDFLTDLPNRMQLYEKIHLAI